MPKKAEILSRFNLISSFNRLPLAAGAFSILIGCCVFIGWLFDIALLKSVLPHLASMKANTALAFILAGTSLWRLGTKQDGRQARRIAQGCALATALIGLLTLAEYAFDRNLGIDQLLFRDLTAIAGAGPPGRPSEVTAFNFVLLGLALWLLAARRRRRLADALLIITGLSSLLALIGYAYGVQSLYQIGVYSSVALHTALTFCVLCLGSLFVRSEEGLATLIMSDTPGGSLARRLLPASIVLPVLIGWLRLEGQRAGLYGDETGMAMVAISSIVIFTGLVWSNARLIFQMEVTRLETIEALREANAGLEARVEQRTEDLTKANALLQEQIAERKRVEETLNVFSRKLQQSNKELEEFAYVASHDLQEPLRMVASFVQLLAKRYQGKLDAQADEFIAFAVGGARKMQTLINDLLAYSRVGRKGEPFAPVDCEAVLDYSLQSLQTAIAESGAVITHDALPTVRADQTQMRRLFQNLIGNAIKYRSEAPPHIHISAGRRENTFHFAVRDNGIGLDMAFATRIFTVFQRLHNQETYPGTGIGLAICKKIVELHGGEIHVESAPGAGATFHFTIPA